MRRDWQVEQMLCMQGLAEQLDPPRHNAQLSMDRHSAGPRSERPITTSEVLQWMNYESENKPNKGRGLIHDVYCIKTSITMAGLATCTHGQLCPRLRLSCPR